MEKIKIFDTTLRDGEQAPGFSMNLKEKLMMARQLENLGVDVIEAGFANASPDDFESVKQIAEMCSKTEVCGLARCHEADIEATIKALKNARKPRVHVFIASSDLHLKYKLQISRDEAVKKAIMGVKMAKTFTDRVDFSPEDATRSDRNFLVEILEEAIKAGADTLNIPDTVGYSTPDDFGDLIHFLKTHVKGIDKVIISTHCHNDLGLAVANSLSGILHGARQIECTINGIGERAGNASLEEVVMAMKTRPDIFKFQCDIRTPELLASSKLLTQITGQATQSNKAIVGRNAFAHEAGIHQHGILANSLTYEIMKPEDVGYEKSQLILGKHSGRNALSGRLKSLGIEADEEQMKKIFVKFKQLADRKKNIYDQDLLLLTLEEDEENQYELKHVEISSKNDEGGIAVVEIMKGQECIRERSVGDGAVSALYGAIGKATGLTGKLISYNVRALTPGDEAVGVAHIEWEDASGKHWFGDASDTDVVIASGKALMNVVNMIEVEKNYGKKESVNNMSL